MTNGASSEREDAVTVHECLENELADRASAEAEPNGTALGEKSAMPGNVGDWQTAFDPSSQAWYYFNLATGMSSWNPPANWIPSNNTCVAASNTNDGPDQHAVHHHPAHEDGPRNTTAAGEKPGGYFYIDANNVAQGPYSKERLIAWRAMLPMDLQLWYAEDAQDAGPSEEKKRDSQSETEKRVTVDLASITGDAHLLSTWRAAQPTAGGTTSSAAAPTATAWEYELDDPLLSHSASETEKGGGGLVTIHDALTVAALAGLPADDEAVRLSHAAHVAGKTLDQVVAWNHNKGDYVATAMHSAGRGRVVSSDASRESLYADMGSWVDPRLVEEQLQRAQHGHKRTLTQQELKAVKKRKQEMKDKKSRAWLLD